MTNDTMGLQALVGKSPDTDFLRGMIGFAATRLMELEVSRCLLRRVASYCTTPCEDLAQRHG
jgi:hypothetical protein